MKVFSVVLNLIIFIPLFNCENPFKDVLDSYNNTIIPKFNELNQLQENGTVWSYNLVYSVQLSFITLEKKKIDKLIAKINKEDSNNIMTIENLISENEKHHKLFLKYYNRMLKTVKNSHLFYNKAISVIRLIIIILIIIIVLIILITIIVMIIIHSPKWRNYQLLDEESKKENGVFSGVVKIFNNFTQKNEKTK